MQRKFTTIRSGFKSEQTGHSWQSAMYNLPLINNAVFLCISGIIVLNAVPIHWFPFFLTQKFIPFRCYKNSVQCHPLIFKKSKIQLPVFEFDQKARIGGQKHDHPENAFAKQWCRNLFFKLVISFYVCLNKRAYRIWEYWFISRLFWWFLHEKLSCLLGISPFQWNNIDEPVINMNVAFSNTGRLRFY